MDMVMFECADVAERQNMHDLITYKGYCSHTKKDLVHDNLTFNSSLPHTESLCTATASIKVSAHSQREVRCDIIMFNSQCPDKNRVRLFMTSPHAQSHRERQAANGCLGHHLCL